MISLKNEPDSYVICCDPEDEGSMVLQNVGTHMQKHIVSQHQRLRFELSLSWKLEKTNPHILYKHKIFIYKI